MSNLHWMSLFITRWKNNLRICRTQNQSKSQFISAGCTEFGYNWFSSTIPRRITIALIDHSAFDGSFTYSPFNFNHIDCAQSHFMLAGIFIPRFHITSTFPTHIQRAHVSTCIRFASCECNLPALESEGANFNSWQFYSKPSVYELLLQLLQLFDAFIAMERRLIMQYNSQFGLQLNINLFVFVLAAQIL